MQVSAFFGLQSALSGIIANQRALDITSNNVTNAGTEGYSRQEAVYSASTSLRLSGGMQSGNGAWLGSGVSIEQFRRMRDGFLDIQYRAQHTTSSYDTEKADGLRRAMDELNEPGENGLNSLLDRFWNSFHELANSPSDASVKAAVIGHATTLVNAISSLDNRLSVLENQAGTEFTELTTGAQNPIGPMATELARLNGQIRTAVTAGQSPNELLDRRDLLIDKLAEYGTVTVTEQGYGAVQIDFGGAATPLVDDVVATWPQALSPTPGGKLQALLDVQSTVASYRADLDNVASSLATTVNAAHTVGGAPNFFNGTTASTIAVNVTTATLAAGSGGTVSSNDIARAIAALGNGATDDLYGTFVIRVGQDVNLAESAANASAALEMTIDNRRKSVSGVSMDEEMTNMIRFQRAYQASARTMNAMDEMLDTIVNRMGRVGL